MACSLKSSSFLSESSAKLCPSSPVQFGNSQFMGQSVVPPNQKATCFSTFCSPKSVNNFSINVHASYTLKRPMRWWEKSAKPNMIDIQSAQELVETLKKAGDSLVVVDFYSPSCGGCRALHPKICQLAESHPDVIFLKVNHEELNKMCHALHIHVLPFFRLYKGSLGRLCSFSCTVSTIKKLKDALAKHSTQQQPSLVIGPAKGLDESELLRLASVGEIEMIPEAPLQPSIEKEEIEHFLVNAIQKSTAMNMTGEPMAAKNTDPMLVA